MASASSQFSELQYVDLPALANKRRAGQKKNAEHRRGERYVHVLALRPEHLLSQHEPAERPAAHRRDAPDDEAPEEFIPAAPAVTTPPAKHRVAGLQT